MPITTDVVSLNLDQGEVYNIMCQIKFVSDLSVDRHDITEILVALNTIKQTNWYSNYDNVIFSISDWIHIDWYSYYDQPKTNNLQQF